MDGRQLMRTPWLPTLFILRIPVMLLCLEMLFESEPWDLPSMLKAFTPQVIGLIIICSFCSVSWLFLAIAAVTSSAFRFLVAHRLTITFPDSRRLVFV